MPWAPPPPPDDPLLKWALYYIKHGWPVFPLQGKDPMGKLAPHGFYNATLDPFQVNLWWQAEPLANIGSPMGNGKYTVDIDPRHGGDAELFRLTQQHGQLPNTLLSHTGGGGDHYIFLEPPGGIKKGKLVPGIDIQGQGSYIVLPPSKHPDTGRLYLWDLVDGPDDIDPVRAPAWLEQMLVQGQGNRNRAPLTPEAPILLGEQEDRLTSMAGSMRRAGASADEIYAALEAMNARCQPPVLPKDLQRIARSIARYALPEPEGEMVLDHTMPVLLQAPLPMAVNDYPQPAPGPQVWGTPRQKLQLTDLSDMLKKTYPLPKWLIDDLIPEGLTFFVGKPKSSKTYLAYSLGLSLVMAMQQGSLWLDHYPIRNPGPVVYITLEDDESESWQRILELEPGLQDLPPSRFLFHHGIDFPHLGADLVTAIEEDIIQVYRPSLIVLDPISYLYAPTKKGADQFADVKDMLLPLRWLGKQHHLTILGVDHRRKSSVDDVDIFESTYGSNAKIAVADALLMIVRDAQEITLHSKVRKAEEQTITLGLTWNDQGRATWEWKGAINGLLNTGQYGDLRQKLIEALSGFQQPMGMPDMLAALNMPDSKVNRNSLYQILFRAQKSGEVQKTTRGQYVWAGGN